MNKPKRLRIKLGLTQVEFGEILGYQNPQNRVSGMERGSEGISGIVNNFLIALEFIHQHKLMAKFKNYLHISNKIKNSKIALWDNEKDIVMAVFEQDEVADLRLIEILKLAKVDLVDEEQLNYRYSINACSDEQKIGDRKVK